MTTEHSGTIQQDRLEHASTSTISVGRPPLRVALSGDPLASELPIVVRRPTLRDAQRARGVLRAGSRDPANFVVALEIEAAIAPSAASARASADLYRHDDGSLPGDSETVRYVGTPRGLVSLIRDIYAAEVADAVIVTPIDGSATEVRVREEVLPALFAFETRVA